METSRQDALNFVGHTTDIPTQRLCSASPSPRNASCDWKTRAEAATQSSPLGPTTRGRERPSLPG